MIYVAQMPKKAQKFRHGLLTTAEVAGRLEVSPHTINRWVNSGRITPAVQAPGIRGPRFFTAEAVEQLQDAR